MTDSSHAARVQEVEAFVKQRIAHHDASHDWFHIHRVRNMALTLAAAERLSREERQLAELAALLHDVVDHKYSADPEEDRRQLHCFLAEQLGLGPEEQELVLYVVENLGFNEELARKSRAAGNGSGADVAASTSNGSSGMGQEPLEARERVLVVVQDADRLDAIGAIGIARCLTFGGSFRRILHDPAVPPRMALTQEQYTDNVAQQTTLNHFPEKLFKLKDLMRTVAGQQMAEARDSYMREFVQRFHQEWEAAG